MNRTPEERADELFDAAKAKSDAGDDQAALALYLESLALDRKQPSALYNVGLIYKYRRDWKECLRYNRLAAELRPDDEATNWNIGIAATALREWRIAREAWKRAGLTVDDGDAPIAGKFGYTPVRLNGFEGTDAPAEVVWATRLSPVTARVENIPTPATRFRFGDVVLHDGAANGTRLYAPGDERPVFDVFEVFEPSDYMTFDVHLIAPRSEAIEELEAACEAADVQVEDWTKTCGFFAGRAARAARTNSTTIHSRTMSGRLSGALALRRKMKRRSTRSSSIGKLRIKRGEWSRWIPSATKLTAVRMDRP